MPAFGALAAEPLFLLADAAIVGRLGTAELAGLGVAAAVLLNAMYLFIFLAFGTTAAVARRLGGGDLRGALAQGVHGLWLATAIGAAIAILGIPLAPLVVEAFGTSSDATPHAVTYLRISLLGMPAMLVVLTAMGVLRGLQNTRTPLLVASVAGLVNVALNLALVHGIGMGIAGSALGTVIAQVGAACWLVVMVGRRAGAHGTRLRPEAAGIREAGTLGLPLFLRTITLRIALLATTYVATSQGDVALASHQVAFTLWSFLAIVPDSLAVAAQALVGRYLGAGDPSGARAIARRMVLWGVASTSVLGLLMIALRGAYIPVFTTDLSVRNLLAAVVLVVAAMQPLGGVVFVLDGVLIGAGDGRYLAWAGVGTLVVFLPLAALVMLTGSGLVALWWALTAFLVARLVTVVRRQRSDRWLVTGAGR